MDAKRHPSRAACTSLLLSAALLNVATAAAAADLADVFELEGNVLDGSPPASPDRDDWSTLRNGVGGEVTATAIPVTEAPNVTIFGGGDKDIKDYPAMSVTNGSVPDKDDIRNAAAAAYQSNGDLIFYFVADRFATAGDAFIGAWFHQDEVAVSGSGFSGQKTLGDILILVNFVNGGSVPVVEVLEWDPVACPTKDPGNSDTFGVGKCPGDNLQILFKQQARCAAAGPNADACAIANGGGEAATWAYTPKTGIADAYPPNSLFEGGINITKLLGAGQTCFSTFLIETRSSSSETAQLKDFVLGAFPLCSVEISKTCSDAGTYDADAGAILVPWTVTVTNNGFGAVGNVEVTDDNCGLGSSTVENTGPIASGASVQVTGNCVVTGALPDPFRNGASAVADDGAIPVSLAQSCATDNSAPGVCFDACNVETSPSIEVEQSCSTRLVSADGVVAVEVGYAGSVKNTSDETVPTPLTDVEVAQTAPEAGGPITLHPTAEDAAAGTNAVASPVVLAPGDVLYFAAAYKPAAPDDPTATCASEADFGSAVEATGDDLFTGESVSDTANSSCNLCVDCEAAE